jgi:hypothetical protein
MTHPSKAKGNNFERELVKQAVESGLTAERAYASNGRALGEAETVDVLIAQKRIQAKRRKKLADFLQLPEGCDAVVIRQDRGDSMVLLPWFDFLDLLKASGK